MPGVQGTLQVVPGEPRPKHQKHPSHTILTASRRDRIPVLKLSLGKRLGTARPQRKPLLTYSQEKLQGHLGSLHTSTASGAKEGRQRLALGVLLQPVPALLQPRGPGLPGEGLDLP
jgi:hypothetical protein